MSSFGKYRDYQALARLEYGRLLWKKEQGREKLLANWTHTQHPHREHFIKQRNILENLLNSQKDYQVLDADLRRQSSSLRAAMRDIPSYFPTLTNPPK